MTASRVCMALLLCLPIGLPAQEASTESASVMQEARKQVALVQDQRAYTVGDVLDAVGRYDPNLLTALRAPGYLKLHLKSTRFLRQARALSDLIALDAAGIPNVERPALLAEAKAWAADLGSGLLPEAALASYGLEIEVRARLLALQPARFGINQLRQHFHSSVPEFYGQLQISWIRLPLVDFEQGAVLPEAERRARHGLLDEVATRISDGELTWDQAVQRYSEDPHTKEANGRVPYLIRRGMVPRFEEALLRHTFADLGMRRLEGSILRGPILGEAWVYLVRVEALVMRGVPDLQKVLGRVERSFRDRMLREKLKEITAETQRIVHAPILLD